jgi:superfamily II DNA/RNA helicase
MGGISMTEQMDLINAGVDIITAAPGRISDLVAQNKILLSHIRFFILDEAVRSDHMSFKQKKA